MQQKFTTLVGICAPLLRDNIDTDVIIPSREMKRVSKDGLSDGLFADWRYLNEEARIVNPDFVLNQDKYKSTKILLGLKNFGCGSSREHAVWALKEYGIRCIIAESFGSIFYLNCISNGVLPLCLEKSQVVALSKYHQLSIDLPAQLVKTDNDSFSFEISPIEKKLLLEGLSPIAITLTQKSTIDEFRQTDLIKRPWIYKKAMNR